MRLRLYFAIVLAIKMNFLMKHVQVNVHLIEMDIGFPIIYM